MADYGARGIVVFNTPGANANAVKELVLAGMLMAARHPARHRLRALAGQYARRRRRYALLEKEKSRFGQSGELRGKTLGIVGLGAIGSMLADAALALGMKVLGRDPALSIDAAWRLSNAVQRMDSLPALLARADYVSLHVPAIDATRGMIGAEALAQIKPGAVLLNFARESIVDPAAVLAALAGRPAPGRYVCDFPEPGFADEPRVIAMPHIGASAPRSRRRTAP